ncbi:MAG: hypothetical protein B9S32_10155 [Verrucomicrobia bacterium Tous-C9LFEB]|nr:MAG: hypothetical protein B9S32_10155 [Verrucomicrobia bacterium Tous-C9LFEB]
MKHYLGICLILLTAAAIALFFIRRCENAVARTASSISKTFLSALSVQPQVSVNQTVILSQTSPIAELAIVSKEALVTYGIREKLNVLSREVPLTGKTLTAQAAYRMKAGYNLKEPFLVQIDSTSGRITAQLPPARLLSVERIGPLTLQDEDSLLNRITPQEREKVLNELDAAARHMAQQSGLIEDAEKQAVSRLEELAMRNGQKLFLRLPHQAQ